MVVDKEALCLPNLENLVLDSMTIKGPLRDYLKMPALKHLKLRNMCFLSSGVIASNEDTLALSEGLFPPNYIGLETLVLILVDVDDALLMKLRSSSHLRSIEVGARNHATFIRSLLEGQNIDPESFPSLTQLIIRGPWSEELDALRGELADHCARRHSRVNLYILGDNS
ncbi:hypothetical protein CPB86DRAFT_787707 [Serendipita vermifera]|nr:hypothetical protein CPB86DRAFT_787707 [Serendipita vermifera]